MNAAVEVHDNEVIIREETVLAQFSEFERQLAEFKAEYDGRVYDLDDPKQNKQARSDRLAIGKVIADLDRRHKTVKEPLLAATRVVDGARKRIKDELAAVQDGIKSQIEAHEQRERERVNALEARRAAILDLANDTAPGCLTADGWAARIAEARAIVIDDAWQEFKAEAALAQKETIDALERLHAEAVARETEAAELARLRAEQAAREREEREARIAAEAAERARREAEEAATRERERIEREAKAAQDKAERDAREAKERAEREIAEANARAERAAAEERERIAREQREAEAKAAQERAVEQARKANEQHRAEVERRIADALMGVGLHGDVALAVIAAVRDGSVPHLRIDY